MSSRHRYGPVYVYQKILDGEYFKMETAAAILVQVIISRTSGLQQLLVDKANQSPQAAMEFLRPYYEAALAAIKRAEAEHSALP